MQLQFLQVHLIIKLVTAIIQAFRGNPTKEIYFINYKQFKDTHREKAPSNKTPPDTKSTNMGRIRKVRIWGFGLLAHQINSL